MRFPFIEKLVLAGGFSIKGIRAVFFMIQEFFGRMI